MNIQISRRRRSLAARREVLSSASCGALPFGESTRQSETIPWCTDARSEAAIITKPGPSSAPLIPSLGVGRSRR